MTDLFTGEDIQHTDAEPALIVVEALDLQPLPDDDRPAWDHEDDDYEQVA